MRFNPFRRKPKVFESGELVRLVSDNYEINEGTTLRILYKSIVTENGYMVEKLATNSFYNQYYISFQDLERV